MKTEKRFILFFIVGIFIGAGITYFFINLNTQSKWYTGWECLYWNTTQGIMVSGEGQYVTSNNQTIFATWEQLGYHKTKCVKYVYVKQNWKLTDTI